MARTLTTPTQLSFLGNSVTLAAANAGGHDVPPGPSTFIEVNNGSASSINVTLTVSAKYRGLAISNCVVAVAAGERKKIGPLLPELFADPSDGYCKVDLSAVTTVTIAAYTI